ncbi:MAG: MerR family transcriptional regulator [Anaerolineales bacterium]|uniref:MerR family transcriptional regulator n=1 Tax=Candidatus Desulfolinea nitratireducens TaxID=2841698 RepID=A0A8J6THR9_9CHLR|nr:MerR family transcriptional regulator [Candidatus Desulfolinea nitratireducens]MBL6961026.1 MerR family transcriptional regulator [Anaerolineales bacterium]
MKESATYNLGTVKRETGLNGDTLRAWERRYGLPMPERSAGGQRLYSQHDIEVIKWLISKQTEGLSISRAVSLWNDLTENGTDPLLRERPTHLSQNSSVQLSEENMEDIRNQWISACLAFDEKTAEQVIHRAFAISPLESVCQNIILGGLREIGKKWYAGTATIQQEHFASALAHRRIHALIAASPPPSRTETILIGCPPKEEHTIPALLITLFLRRRGFNVVYLGANVPDIQFKETVESIQPQLVILSAQLLITAATLSETVQLFANRKVPIAYSGNIFQNTPALKERINAHYLGDTFEDALKMINKILKREIGQSFETQPNPFTRLSESFTVSRPAIHASLSKKLTTWDIPLKPMLEANDYLSDNIAAALTLGDLDFISPELRWVNTLLKNRKIKTALLINYLQTFIETITETIGEGSAPLTGWFIENIKNTGNIQPYNMEGTKK